MKKNFTASGTDHHDYPMIPNDTIKDMMGLERWKKILHYVKTKFKQKHVLMGYHSTGGGAHVYLDESTCIGTLAEVETKANKLKKGKKRGKSRK